MSTIFIKDVRLSFPDLWEAKPFKGGAPRYGAVLLVEPGSDNDKVIRKAINEAVKEKLGDKADLFLKKVSGDKGAFCYTDGDLEGREEYEGLWSIRAYRREADGPPAVIDRTKGADGNFITLDSKAGKPYSGCYVNVKVDIYVQTNENKGVRCGLQAVQFVRDGAAFASKPADTEGFEDLGGDEAAVDEADSFF